MAGVVHMIVHRIALLALGLVVLLGGGARLGAQESIEEARQRRQALEQAAAENAAALDLIEAEDQEIVDALERLDAWVVISEAGLDATRQAIDAAHEAEDSARSAAAELDEQIEELRQQVAAQSVETYMGGFDDGFVLETTDLNSVPLLKFLLAETTGRTTDAVDLLQLLLAEQEDLLASAEDAALEAEELRDHMRTRIDKLEEARAQAERMRDELEARKSALEAEAVELAETDRKMVAFIRDEQNRLAAEQAAREAEARRLAEATPTPTPAPEPTPTPEPTAEPAPTPTPEPTATPEPDTAAEPTTEPTATEGATEESPDQPEPTGSPTEGEAADPTVTTTPTDEAVTQPPPDEDEDVSPADSPSFVWPIPASVVSPFGNRVHPVYGTVRFHAGIDIDADSGRPIGAAADGLVLFRGWFGGYGNTVVIDHGGGFTTLYAHMLEANVSLGATVTAGDVIGLVGSTGLSTGPHLHFEIRVDGVAVDPVPYLP